MLYNNVKFFMLMLANEVFDPSFVPSLVGMLKLCLITEAVKDPKMALIALTVRNVDTLALFINTVKGKHAENQTL
jgi:hypothetical protein